MVQNDGYQRIVIKGKRCDLGLGSTSLITLAEARQNALQNRKTARNDGDPLADKRQAADLLTFEEAARQVHALYLPTWTNAKQGRQWISSLTQYAFPHIGTKKVDAITSADVLDRTIADLERKSRNGGESPPTDQHRDEMDNRKRLAQ